MSRVIRVLKTLRNHWKKSSFAAILGYYGVEYARDWHRNYMMMREYSKEALRHGLRPLPPGARNKHITLFLNPTAGNRKAKGKVEKFAEPLLHLSGFLVNTVRTERIDEARDLAGAVEKTNVIVAAGGDGTLFETVTGLIRREDAEQALRRFPLAVVPVGSHNQFAKRIFPKDKTGTEPMFIAEAAMAVVKHKIRPQDVMEISILQEEGEEGSAADENATKLKKPFYSLVGISIGQFREAQKLKEEMPGIFPNYFATFWSLYRTPQKYFKAEVRYVPACEGCVKCAKRTEEAASPESGGNKIETKTSEGPSIWSRIFSVFRPQKVLAQETTISSHYVTKSAEEEPTAVNASCGNWDSFCTDTSELNVRVCGNGRLQIQVNNKLDKTDFMIEGLKRYRKEVKTYSREIDCQAVEIVPVEGQEFMYIDNEEFPMKSVKLKCLKNKVYFFVP